MTEPTTGGCAITGATGYLGGRLAVSWPTAAGPSTDSPVCTPTAPPIPSLTLTVGAPGGFFDCDDVNWLVPGLTKWDDIHPRGSIKLLQAARKAGIERPGLISGDHPGAMVES